jgi:hypothetical protein
VPPSFVDDKLGKEVDDQVNVKSLGIQTERESKQKKTRENQNEIKMKECVCAFCLNREIRR